MDIEHTAVDLANLIRGSMLVEYSGVRTGETSAQSKDITRAIVLKEMDNNWVVRGFKLAQEEKEELVEEVFNVLMCAKIYVYNGVPEVQVSGEEILIEPIRAGVRLTLEVFSEVLKRDALKKPVEEYPEVDDTDHVVNYKDIEIITEPACAVVSPNHLVSVTVGGFTYNVSTSKDLLLTYKRDGGWQLWRMVGPSDHLIGGEFASEPFSVRVRGTVICSSDTNTGN